MRLPESLKIYYGIGILEKKSTSTVYHGNKELLWKTDFPRQYLRYNPELKLVKEMIVPYRKAAFGKERLTLNCFLLEKVGNKPQFLFSC